MLNSFSCAPGELTWKRAHNSAINCRSCSSNDDSIIKPDAKAATAAQAVYTRLHLIQHVIPAVRCIQEL